MNPLTGKPIPAPGANPTVRRGVNPLQMKIGNVGGAPSTPNINNGASLSGPANPQPTIQQPLQPKTQPSQTVVFNNQPSINVQPNMPFPRYSNQPTVTVTTTNQNRIQSNTSIPQTPSYSHKNPLNQVPPSIDTRATGVISKGARSVSELGGGSHNPGIRPFTYHYTPLPHSQIKLGNNIWENYQLVGQEVQKKNQKLTELNNIIRQMRISNDQNQIRNLNIQLANARQELARAISENQQIERQIEQANQKNKALKSEESASEAELQRIVLLAKSPQELNSQLQQLKNEHDKIRASVAKMDYDAKIQLDKESRESMEKKLLEICLESAKKNNDPRVKDLLAKIQAYQKA